VQVGSQSDPAPIIERKTNPDAVLADVHQVGCIWAWAEATGRFQESMVPDGSLETLGERLSGLASVPASPARARHGEYEFFVAINDFDEIRPGRHVQLLWHLQVVRHESTSHNGCAQSEPEANN
jgi:hypothetical protein